MLRSDCRAILSPYSEAKELNSVVQLPTGTLVHTAQTSYRAHNQKFQAKQHATSPLDTIHGCVGRNADPYEEDIVCFQYIAVTTVSTAPTRHDHINV